MSKVRLVVYGLRDDPLLHSAYHFDVQINSKRFKNPHHDRALRQLTGLDQPVIDEVKRAEGFERLIGQYVRTVMELVRERLVVEAGVYCHAGRHRSVVIANELAARLRARGVTVTIEYRNPIVRQRLEELNA
jgi:UPF0042 nucleotide-binding protein